LVAGLFLKTVKHRQEEVVNKTEKKLEKAIVNQLTLVCEETLKSDIGFEWLTHTVDYKRFPKSLKITCVFDTRINLEQAIKNNVTLTLIDKIKSKLELADIRLKKANRQIFFDCEEDCVNQHQGNWEKRLSSHH